ncbi:MAG: hypothetical protein ACFBSG_10380 [Leptolyngbyaceae cyanobacterium]
MVKQNWDRMGMGLAFLSGLLGAIAFSSPVRAEVTVAYCDTPRFAINIFNRNDELDQESPDRDILLVRIYDRQDSISFINGIRVSAENAIYNGVDGVYYTNLRGENEWKLFVPDNPGGGLDPEAPGADADRCALFRDDELMELGQGSRP